MAKFTLEDHDKRMMEIRERTRQPKGSAIERLKEVARRRGGQPRIPREF